MVKRFWTHRSSYAVAKLMSEGQLDKFGQKVTSKVLQGDQPSVQAGYLTILLVHGFGTDPTPVICRG